MDFVEHPVAKKKILIRGQFHREALVPHIDNLKTGHVYRAL
jgi:hypothetical protein